MLARLAARAYRFRITTITHMRKNILSLAAAFLSLALSSLALRAELDLKAIDPSVRPQDDFFEYVNGSWLKTVEIPADQLGWGSFYELADRTRKNLHAICEDDAVNYGGIGSVIGHEMTHGFDDQGRQYDARGNLKDWWTPKSTEAFKKRAAVIIEQFNNYTVLDGALHVNGTLTQGENIADLGGVKIAYAALRRALAGSRNAKAKIDGFTPEQRFFLSYASIWREKRRPEYRRNLIITDPHSPAEWRVRGPLSNLEEFWAAFDVKEGDAMRRAGADIVTIW